MRGGVNEGAPECTRHICGNEIDEKPKFFPQKEIWGNLPEMPVFYYLTRLHNK